MVELEETLREAEEARRIGHSSNYSIVDDPVENDEVLEEILRYAPKEEVVFFN